MHWVADATGLASTGSVFPGYPDHVNEDERRAWRVAAEQYWERLLEMRAAELAPGGWFIAAIPASPAPCPDRTGLYVEIIGDMNRLLADWRRVGRIGSATVEAAVVPVWERTLDEFRAPFETAGGRFAGLKLESAEVIRNDSTEEGVFRPAFEPLGHDGERALLDVRCSAPDIAGRAPRHDVASPFESKRPAVAAPSYSSSALRDEQLTHTIAFRPTIRCLVTPHLLP